jgi:two-component system, chemotaxis family, CheB/CheR fusion protein
MLTIVVLGASAGGLHPLREFLRASSSEPGVAVVVITHLPLHHDSHLVSLLGNVGTLPVRAAVHGESIEGGTAYVLPPGTLMGIREGRFETKEGPPTRHAVRPIDFFMMTLAEDAAERCVGVVLSGTDHDGTAGLKAIKAGGGMTLAQDPGTAEFPGMPRSAIEAGVADRVLPPNAMPAAIREYLGHEPLDLTSFPPPEGTATPTDTSLDGVLRMIHARTGHDFSWYRPSMLRRRLRRRMGLNKIDRVRDYLGLLQDSEEEAEALKNEFLIGVTDFFRDPEAWRELERTVVPALVAGQAGSTEPIRVWTPGCATGEESYSIAMLLLEQFPEGVDAGRVQVFATDIDLDALVTARSGSYPTSSMSNVSPARLARFFDRKGERYVARRSLRDAIVFAPHNLIRDTPYSRLDLVVCRNVLIYFQPELQQRVYQFFHFALKTRGFLLLGTAESVSVKTALFEPASATMRLYRRSEGRALLPSDFGRGAGDHVGVAPRPAPRGTDRARPPDEILRHWLHGREATAAVLLDRDGRALHFHGSTEPFLWHTGTASLELPSIVRPGLRVQVRRAIREAVREHRCTDKTVMLDSDGGLKRVRVQVEPVTEDDNRRMAMVLFSLAPAPAASAQSAVADPQRNLEQEYDEARRELSIALEEAERSNDDLRIAHEESLSLNEELQSSNEELESSKEELQSVNEELATVNAQLEEKILELARSNDDLANLVSSSRVATVVTDRERRIRRFTPSASEVFRLQPGDEGRLLNDISSRVTDPNYARDLLRLDEAGGPVDAELAHEDGRTYLRRLLPFRKADGTLEGVVTTYVDVTPLRNASRRLHELVAVLQDSNDAVIVYDLEGIVLEWNNAAARTYGYRRDEIVGRSMFDLVPENARDELRRQIAVARVEGHIGPDDARRVRHDGVTVTASVTVSVLRDDRGEVYALLSTERDITERMQAEKEMYFRRLADLVPALLRVEDVYGSTEFANQACADFSGRARTTLLDLGWLDLMNPEDRSGYLAAFNAALTRRARFDVDYRWRHADGSYRWVRSMSVPHFLDSGEFAGYVALAVDVEDRKQTEGALLTADQRKDEYLATLAHELRNPLASMRNAVVLMSRSDPAGPQTSWAIGVMSRQVDSLAKLLDDLLDVARVARGKVKLNVAPIDVSVAVERALEVCGPQIESRQQRLTTNLGTGPLFVEGDLLRLTQVLTNLLNNASKYTETGGAIRVDVERSENDALIRISDNGAGIAADMLPRIFDMFAQADRTLDRAKGGLGLGLTLVRRLVELHHGTVEATSAGPGEGSQFVVRLPALSAIASAPIDVPDTDDLRPQATRRVLIVDDNTDASESLAMLLRLRGHDVRTARDSEEALRIADRHPMDVAILDIGLPGLDGYQLARVLRGRGASTRTTLIALTGYSQPDDVTRAAAAGFDHHIVKPADPDRIATLVEAADVLAGAREQPRP